MKKEKTVKTHTRKTKSGKTVTVKQHTAKYDAAEQAKEIVKKAGAGAELERVKKTKMQEDPYKDFDFTAEEFAEWYEGTGSAADKKVEKALRKALGRKAYDELNDAAAEGYKKGGASKFFTSEVGTAMERHAAGSPTKLGKMFPDEDASASKTKKVEIPAGKEKAPKSKGKKKEEFSATEREMALMVYDLSGEDNNLPPKLAAWAKKEAQRQDRERAKKADVGVLKELDTKVIGKLEALQKKGPNLTKREEKYIEDHVDERGIIIGTKVRASEAINAYRKAQKTGILEQLSGKGSKSKKAKEEPKDKKESPTPKSDSVEAKTRPTKEELSKNRFKERKAILSKMKEGESVTKSPSDWGGREEPKKSKKDSTWAEKALYKDESWLKRNKWKKEIKKSSAHGEKTLRWTSPDGSCYVDVEHRIDGNVFFGNPKSTKTTAVPKTKTRKKKKNTPEQDAALDATLAEIRERNKQPYQVSRRV